MSPRHHADHGLQPWRHVLHSRPSAGWPLNEKLLEQHLRSALTQGLSIDSGDLCMRLSGMEEPSLLCAVMGAHCRHMPTPGALMLVDLLARHGASFRSPCPLEALIAYRDAVECQPDPTPLLRRLLDHGADLPALVQRKGMPWITSTLEGEGDDQAAEFLLAQEQVLEDHSLLNQATPSLLPARALRRF